MKWIDVEKGERPKVSQLCLGWNSKLSYLRPKFVIWSDNYQEFISTDTFDGLPIKITHYCEVHAPTKVKQKDQIIKEYAI